MRQWRRRTRTRRLQMRTRTGQVREGQQPRLLEPPHHAQRRRGRRHARDWAARVAPGRWGGRDGDGRRPRSADDVVSPPFPGGGREPSVRPQGGNPGRPPPLSPPSQQCPPSRCVAPQRRGRGQSQTAGSTRWRAGRSSEGRGGGPGHQPGGRGGGGSAEEPPGPQSADEGGDGGLDDEFGGPISPRGQAGKEAAGAADGRGREPCTSGDDGGGGCPRSPETMSQVRVGQGGRPSRVH